MATLGDIIPQLSTIIPIPGTGTFESLPFVISEYNSLSFIMLSDVDTTVSAKWSSDGINYYYSDTFTFVASTADLAVAAVASKWVKIVITNTHLTPVSNQMDFKVYASPGTNAVNAIIKGITAKILAKIDVKNSFDYSATGELMTENLIADQQFMFNKCSGVTAGGFYSTYNNITLSTTGTTGGIVADSGGQGCVTIFDQGPTGAPDVKYTGLTSNKYTKWLPGYGLSCMFSCAFNNSISQTTGATGCDYLLCGMGNQSDEFPPRILDGVMMGFTGSTGATQSDIPSVFGIFIYRYAGIYKFIPQNQWNIDKCDGDGPAGSSMPIVTNWKNMFTYKFNILPQGELLVSILNPNSGSFSPVHFEKFSNITTLGTIATFSDPSFQMIARYDSTTSTLGNILGSGLNLASWMIGFETAKPNYRIDRFNKSIGSYVKTKTSPYLLIIQSPVFISDTVNMYYEVAPLNGIYNSLTFNGYPNHTTVYIDNIALGSISVGTVISPFYTIQLYKNITYTDDTNPFTNFVDQNYSPVKWGGGFQINAAGFTGSTPLVEIPIQYFSGANGAFYYDLTPYDIQLYPNDYLVAIGVALNTSSDGTNSKIYQQFITTSFGFHQLH